jgi:hypothetical protein
MRDPDGISFFFRAFANNWLNMLLSLGNHKRFLRGPVIIEVYMIEYMIDAKKYRT